MKNYRPVSNLPFLSKIIEKAAVQQMNQHMTENDLHESNQSAYRKNHSTETALLKIFNDILCAVDSKQCVLLVLLDLSAAFDTVEHSILFQRMEQSFGISGDALLWLKSYFANRTQKIKIENVSSKEKPLEFGVPQGSFIGPFCFPKYSSPLAKIASKYQLSIHLYADDTQLYLAFEPESGEVSKELVEECLREIRDWMTKNMLKLNDSKTEYIIIGSKHSLAQIPNIHTLSVGQDEVSSSSSVKNIGAIIDENLSMHPQISNISRSCYLHIRHIGQIRKYLTKEATQTLVHAFITSKLDNLNSLLFGVPDYLIQRLQRIQNQSAKLILCKKKFDHATPLLKELHWLPVTQRLDYKILLLTYKCIHNQAPIYLSSLLKKYTPTRNLRSSAKDLLVEPAFRTETFGKRAFSVIAPRLWNCLPNNIKEACTVDSFKSALKTHLFKKAYS